MELNFLSIDANQRVLPPLKVKKDSSKDYNVVTRVVKAVLPLIALYQPIGAVAQASTFTAEVISEIKNYQGYKEAFHIAWKITAAATMIVQPLMVSTALHTAEFASRILKAYHAKTKTEKAWELLKAAHEVVYIASLYSMSAEILMVSLVAQAGLEVYKAYRFNKEGMTLEAAIQVIVAVIRGHLALTQVDRVKRNWFARKLTQAEFETIVREHQTKEKRDANPLLQDFISAWLNPSEDDTVLDLEKELKARNISNIIEDLNLSRRNLSDYRLSHVHMKDCNFTSARLNNAFIEHVVFTDNNWSQASVQQSRFNDTTFNNCSMVESVFRDNVFDKVTFVGCDLERVIFFGSAFKKVTIALSKLTETNFFYATAEDSSIVSSSLTNTIMEDAKFDLINSENVKTQPVVAIESYLESGYPPFVSEVVKSLRRLGATVLFYPASGPEVDSSRLKEEVKACATKPEVIRAHEQTESIAQKLFSLEENAEEIHKVKAFGEALMRHADGVVIPGGEDVNQIFYGKEASWGDYKHDMMQFAVVHAADKLGKRIMGICRGSQLVNVFFGGTLKNVRDQWGTQTLRFVNTVNDKVKKLIHAIVNTGRIRGESMHGQASDKIGRGLHVALEYRDVPKAFLDDSGRIVLTQFHPESFAHLDGTQAGWRREYATENITANANFYNQFLGKLSQPEVEAA